MKLTRVGNEWQERYDCPLCRDTGWVRCLHPVAVQYRDREGSLPPRGHHALCDCVVPCSCQAGAVIAGYRKCRQYDRARDCALERGVGVGNEATAALVEDWLVRREELSRAAAVAAHDADFGTTPFGEGF